MKKTRKPKNEKKLLVSVDKVRPLQPEKLDNIVGGNAEPCPCPNGTKITID